MKIISIMLFVSLLVVSCREDRKHPVQFYYWKSNVSFGIVEKDYFEKLGAEKLYIRFFDIDKQDDDIKPLAKIRLFDATQLNATYIPVVFITNRVFSRISEEQMKGLVGNITGLIEEIRVKNNMPEIGEIQIDCDWTESTKDAYFHFLELFRTTSGKRITCTLRLHQVKFKEKTGVPPVDKGFLMCYATSDPKESSDMNSILDLSLLKDYTATIGSYPIDFDVALPIYSWGIVTNHLGKNKLINQLTSHDFESDAFRKVTENRFEVLEDCFVKGFYLNKSFTVKVEVITPQLLNEAKKYLDQKINRPYDIIYYHLDQPFLKSYTIQELQ